MTDLRTLRDRIATALHTALPESAADVGFYQRLGVTPLVDIEAYDLNLELLADAVIDALGLEVLRTASADTATLNCLARDIAHGRVDQEVQP